MHVVPVIDLQGGLVVRAAGGDRKAYRPIETPLSKSPAPVSIVQGFLGLYPFDTLYIADLDAIEGGTIQRDALSLVKESFGALTLWVDCGIRTKRDFRALRELEAGEAVLGSESLLDLELLREQGIILSLDFKRGSFLGCQELIASPGRWPDRVIVMSLDQVGANKGPDIARLRQVISEADPNRRIYAAGGIRGPADLELLDEAGAAGALVSSALHAERLQASDLTRLNRKTPPA